MVPGLEPMSPDSQPGAFSSRVHLTLPAERVGKVYGVREFTGGIKSLFQTNIPSLGYPGLNSQPFQKENCYG